jgi:hypothetical protein
MTHSTDKPENPEKTPEERIALGECVSPMTVDQCPHCVDTCKAAHWRIHINSVLTNLNIESNDKK